MSWMMDMDTLPTIQIQTLINKDTQKKQQLTIQFL